MIPLPPEVEQFNSTRVDYPQQKLIHQLFEEQVDRTPRATAVVYEAQSLTYTELNQKANQLARYLRDKGAGPDEPVGICVERSLEMVVGLLGILKAGGAYVPLDPVYPPERLQYMLEDSLPKVLLTQTRLTQTLPQTTAAVIALDDVRSTIAQHSAENLEAASLRLYPHHLAYVIYTSGSTGRPKGAMNEHRGVVNRLQWMQDAYQLGGQDRVLQKTPFGFDVSVWEFFWTLMSGAALIIARPEGHKDPAYLRQLIEATGVTTLHFVPSMLRAFLDSVRSGDCSSLRHIVCSGEELPVVLQKKCFDCLPQAHLSNLYGPTEAAVDVTAWECHREDISPRTPIGRPISNIQMYVLDPQQHPVPIGVAGELHIGGVGVGRGYLNRPELTAERFISDPFSPDPRARLYKTGDLGRWRADGALEYLGRNDSQVKIRGFRIELGEIEAHLTRHPQVKEAVVLARDDGAGEKQLIAYVVAKQGVPQLREHLKETLPQYMIPTRWVMLSRLPLTPNGKVDRRVLPEPGAPEEVGEYVAPGTPLERVLVDVWKEVLRLDHLGTQNNFFDVGGHSLHATKLIARTAEQLGVELTIADVLQFPTVEKMAQLIASSQRVVPEEPGGAGAVEYEEGVI
jgi:amino acid adenylation domain-containing protein